MAFYTRRQHTDGDLLDVGVKSEKSASESSSSRSLTTSLTGAVRGMRGSVELGGGRRGCRFEEPIVIVDEPVVGVVVVVVVVVVFVD